MTETQVKYENELTVELRGKIAQLEAEKERLQNELNALTVSYLALWRGLAGLPDYVSAVLTGRPAPGNQDARPVP